MFCGSCGKENRDDAAVCETCGQILVNPYEASSTAGGAVGETQKPNNYLVHSILATLCCCLPLGVVAIVYAAQVDAKWNGGDQQGAKRASESAKMWFWISFGLGILTNLIAVGFQVFAAASRFNAEF